jgi:hypothetical protein
MDRADSTSPPSSHRIFSLFSETRWINWLFGIGAVMVFLGVVLGPASGPTLYPESAAMQTSRSIELAMFQYANDHGGNYPDGHSSTEVFQKLVDGQYIINPELFYLKMDGKTKATSNHLLPENVAYDVTVLMNAATPDDVPGVFSTGYRIEYRPGGSAIPIAHRAHPEIAQDGIAVSYHNNNASYTSNDRSADGIVTNIVPVDANIGKVPYVQLTPNGPLGPN